MRHATSWRSCINAIRFDMTALSDNPIRIDLSAEELSTVAETIRAQTGLRVEEFP